MMEEEAVDVWLHAVPRPRTESTIEGTKSLGEMIACDNSKCKIEWFPLKCLKMTKAPKGKVKWYCPDCRTLEQFKRLKKMQNPEVAS